MIFFFTLKKTESWSSISLSWIRCGSFFLSDDKNRGIFFYFLETNFKHGSFSFFPDYSSSLSLHFLTVGKHHLKLTSSFIPVLWSPCFQILEDFQSSILSISWSKSNNFVSKANSCSVMNIFGIHVFLPFFQTDVDFNFKTMIIAKSTSGKPPPLKLYSLPIGKLKTWGIKQNFRSSVNNWNLKHFTKHLFEKTHDLSRWWRTYSGKRYLIRSLQADVLTPQLCFKTG